MTLIPFTKYLIAIDAGNVAHAVEGHTFRPTSETLCGAPAELYAVATCIKDSAGEWVESGILQSWPPRVSKWKELNGGSRCRGCYVKSGKPPVSASFDGVQQSDGVFGPCDQVREREEAS